MMEIDKILKACEGSPFHTYRQYGGTNMTVIEDLRLLAEALKAEREEKEALKRGNSAYIYGRKEGLELAAEIINEAIAGLDYDQYAKEVSALVISRDAILKEAGR